MFFLVVVPILELKKNISHATVFFFFNVEHCRIVIF